jgi:hypothetical protein
LEMLRLCLSGMFLLGGVMASQGCLSERCGVPGEMSESPRAILRHYCEAWRRGDYDSMYCSISAERKEQITRKEWKRLWKVETRVRGLLLSYEITGPAEDTGNKSLWTVKATYKNQRVGTLVKTTWVIEEEKGWRVDAGGLAPAGK